MASITSAINAIFHEARNLDQLEKLEFIESLIDELGERVEKLSAEEYTGLPIPKTKGTPLPRKEGY